MSSNSSFSMFDEAASTQVAAKLLKLSGGRLSSMTLMRLMYLVEREALLRWGHPVTHDSYVSTFEGPMLSNTLALMEHPENGTVWGLHISRPIKYGVSLLKECSLGALSQVENELVDEIFGEWDWDDQNLFTHVRAFTEWKDPGISYQDILRAGGKSEDEIKVIEDEIEGSRYMGYILAFAALGKSEVEA